MNPKNLVFAVLAIVILVGGVFLAVSILNAPATSSIQEQSCLAGVEGECLLLPQVTGENLLGEELTFPQTFSADYNVVIMPFDRDQQTSALDWLEPLQTLAQANENLDYYSIAALPDLNPAVRLLVVSGMNIGMNDPMIQEKAVVLFLEDQDAFTQALQVENIEVMETFVMNVSGEILWRHIGHYSPEAIIEIEALLVE